ncbi:MAG: hypothetical protein ACFFG0_38505 [Candidatus Thorarchaeota archaeon]
MTLLYAYDEDEKCIVMLRRVSLYTKDNKHAWQGTKLRAIDVDRLTGIVTYFDFHLRFWFLMDKIPYDESKLSLTPDVFFERIKKEAPEFIRYGKFFRCYKCNSIEIEKIADNHLKCLTYGRDIKLDD